jgi:hypothetical protein
MNSGADRVFVQSPRFQGPAVQACGQACRGGQGQARSEASETPGQTHSRAASETLGLDAPEAPRCPYCGAGKGQPCRPGCLPGGGA